MRIIDRSSDVCSSDLADHKYPALHGDRPHAAMPLDKGVLHFAPFAKYAVAFPRMSRSIFTRASSARSRAISICSALTGLLSAPVSWPRRLALTPLKSVCSTRPRVRSEEHTSELQSLIRI